VSPNDLSISRWRQEIHSKGLEEPFYCFSMPHLSKFSQPTERAVWIAAQISLHLNNRTYAVTGQQGGLAGCKPAKNPFACRGSAAAAAATARMGFRGSVASPKPTSA
jgi:hypothetical protein